MKHRVCPWWLGYCLTWSWLRRGQDPHKLLAPYVREGMTVLEPGPGMGFFTLELARLVGSSGRVVAVDVQPKMLDRLKRRAAKAGISDRIDARTVPPESMNLDDLRGSVDFTLAFAVVHEFPNAARFFAEVSAACKPGASLLLAEPAGHVRAPDWERELQAAAAASFSIIERPKIPRSHTAVLRR